MSKTLHQRVEMTPVMARSMAGPLVGSPALSRTVRVRFHASIRFIGWTMLARDELFINAGRCETHSEHNRCIFKAGHPGAHRIEKIGGEVLNLTGPDGVTAEPDPMVWTWRPTRWKTNAGWMDSTDPDDWRFHPPPPTPPGE